MAETSNDQGTGFERAEIEPRATGYSWYVLGVLVVVYILNFIDRQIVSILAVDIKADLGLTDGDLGFLGGAAFAVFYALFGIPLGRLADNWNRKKLLAIGLTLWSAMTALSGFAQTQLTLTLARMGVGVGEATASPTAYSLISDYFPKRQRATALAIYSSGLYIGGVFGTPAAYDQAAVVVFLRDRLWRMISGGRGHIEYLFAKPVTKSARRLMRETGFDELSVNGSQVWKLGAYKIVDDVPSPAGSVS